MGVVHRDHPPPANDWSWLWMTRISSKGGGRLNTGNLHPIFSQVNGKPEATGDSMTSGAMWASRRCISFRISGERSSRGVAYVHIPTTKQLRRTRRGGNATLASPGVTRGCTSTDIRPVYVSICGSCPRRAESIGPSSLAASLFTSSGIPLRAKPNKGSIFPSKPLLLYRRSACA